MGESDDDDDEEEKYAHLDEYPIPSHLRTLIPLSSPPPSETTRNFAPVSSATTSTRHPTALALFMLLSPELSPSPSHSSSVPMATSDVPCASAMYGTIIPSVAASRAAPELRARRNSAPAARPISAGGVLMYSSAVGRASATMIPPLGARRAVTPTQAPEPTARAVAS